MCSVNKFFLCTAADIYLFLILITSLRFSTANPLRNLSFLESSVITFGSYFFLVCFGNMFIYLFDYINNFSLAPSRRFVASSILEGTYEMKISVVVCVATRNRQMMPSAISHYLESGVQAYLSYVAVPAQSVSSLISK